MRESKHFAALLYLFRYRRKVVIICSILILYMELNFDEYLTLCDLYLDLMMMEKK